MATAKIVAAALAAHGVAGAVSAAIVGPGRAVGELLIQDSRLALISFTGSTAIGTRIATAVHSRFGRTILELGRPPRLPVPVSVGALSNPRSRQAATTP